MFAKTVYANGIIYFSGFEKLDNARHDCTKKVIACILIGSYFTLIIPAIIGCALAITYLIGRCTPSPENNTILAQLAVVGNAKETTLLKRERPPLGPCDEMKMTPDGIMIPISPIYTRGILFKDEEIVEKLEVINKMSIGYNDFTKSTVYAEYTRHGKAIILQQALRSCTAAATAMLIIDHHRQPELKPLITRDLGKHEDEERDIRTAGLQPITEKASTLETLRAHIVKNGSAIVSTNKGIGGHSIVVDDVSEDLGRIRLRDPFHGWEITVTKEAFIYEWGSGGSLLQVAKN